MIKAQVKRLLSVGAVALTAGVAAAGSCIISGSTDRPFGTVSDSEAIATDIRTCSASDSPSWAPDPFDARIYSEDWLEIEGFSSFPRLGFLLFLR